MVVVHGKVEVGVLCFLLSLDRMFDFIVVCARQSTLIFDREGLSTLPINFYKLSKVNVASKQKWFMNCVLYPPQCTNATCEISSTKARKVRYKGGQNIKENWTTYSLKNMLPMSFGLRPPSLSHNKHLSFCHLLHITHHCALLARNIPSNLWV